MASFYIFISAILLVTLLVYLRHISRRHVASLFRTSVQKQVGNGEVIENAMREAIQRLRRRHPFNRIEEEEISFFIDVLQDLESPVEVGAEILQDCERHKDASCLKEQEGILQLAYSVDLKISFRRLIRNAKALQKKLARRYPSITLALLASLSVRNGWTFVEEQSEALLFRYRQKDVCISKHGSGKDAARAILFEEIAQRPLLIKNGKDYETRLSARQVWISKFDRSFENIFQNSVI
jgi:hypothetical protein